MAFIIETDTPGVGKYNATQGISNSGKYINSQIKGGSQPKFGRQSRATFLDETIKTTNKLPGPGFYRAPS